MDVKHSLHFQQSHRPAKTQPVRWLFATHDLECEKAGVISKRGVPSLAPGFYGAGSIPAGTQLWNQSLVFMPLCSRQQRGSSTLFSRRTFDWEKQWECAIDPETAKSIRADRSPEEEDSCSMCGKFCAVRSMNKALKGEYIDIL